MPRLTLVLLVSGILLGLSFVMLHGQSVNTVQAAGQSIMLNNEPALNAAGNSYIVNSTADTPDADVGNPVCADASGMSSAASASQRGTPFRSPIAGRDRKIPMRAPRLAQGIQRIQRRPA